MPKIQIATFKLRCVGCGIKEDRPAEECREMPFCKKCFMPMVLLAVTVKNRRTKETTQ
jgi:rRNA maturation endonuclease Nob1